MLHKSSRATIAFVHDLVMAALSFGIALYLRLGPDFLALYGSDNLIAAMAAFTGIAGAVFWTMKMYRGIWRYASVNDLTAITKAVTLSILIFLPVLFFMTRLEALPRSVLIINWFILMALLGGPRFLYRLLKDRRLDLRLERGDKTRIPVLLAGAGDQAEMFIRALRANPDAKYRVVGCIGRTDARVGRNIHGVEILGTFEELPRVVKELTLIDTKPQRLILTREDLDGAVVGDLLQTAESLGMTMARAPRPSDLREGISDKIEVRPVAIEDLLGRPQAVLDRTAMAALIEGRRVLITGAGGSIGSELVRQASDFAPASLAMVENSEFSLYSIDLELGERHPALPRRAFIADVRDGERLQAVFADFRPEIVFHAAALKHVPMVEANPCEGVRTNVFGTKVVADACRAHGVKVMVLISTDKAVNPTNVMGATKRIAELYVQALDIAGRETGEATHYVAVRFGNVLGSTGSVVPLFQRQLARGGPLTVTHPEVTRYFMTIREAVQLVLQASVLGDESADYRGKLFVLDMGPPVKIIDLARQMIRLAGLHPDKDVAIEITGLRPGEKLYEEPLHTAESVMPTRNEKIFVAAPRPFDEDSLRDALAVLATACRAEDAEAARAVIKSLVPEMRDPDGH